MLEISEITKLYSPKTGIRDITLSIPSGQIVAFIGPNGAGKSTLFNIIGRILKADAGSCVLDGLPLHSLPISQIGFLPENTYLLEEFTPLQMLYFMNAMKEIGASEADVEKLVFHFGINAFMNKRIKALSLGMRKRVAVACALLGRPKLLVLDEPLNSLDIQSVLALKDILKDYKDGGTITIFSSHVLDFIDATVDQTVLLKSGKVLEVLNDSSERLEDIYRKHYLPERDKL